MAVSGIGLAGYFQVGALSNLSQVDAIIMMAAGGGSGIILFVIGAVGSVISYRQYRHAAKQFVVDTDQISEPTIVTGNPQSSSSQEAGLVYGPEAWNAEVLDQVPEQPEIKWDENDPFFNEPYRENFVLIYIPKRVKINNDEMELTLDTVERISSCQFKYLSQNLEKDFGKSTASGWTLISKTVIPGSRNKHFEMQKEMATRNGFRTPQILEAIALNLMVFKDTGARLYGARPLLTHTRCFEEYKKFDGTVYPIDVSYFDANALEIGINFGFSKFENDDTKGAAVVWKF